jgi:hypothetical protein
VKNQTSNRERGIALFFSLFALLLLTAIGAAMIFMAGTETSVNWNYRQEQMAYFGAKAGVEEARARMMPSDPNTVYLSPGSATKPLFDPALVAAPTTANSMIYYITNPGNGAAIQPWLSTDPYFDDELCHEGYTGFNTGATPPEERCPSGSLPGGSWHQSFASNLPFNGTLNALPYKWVRVAPKLNGSANYLSGSGASPTTATYSVDTNTPATVGGVTAPITGSTLVCWDGTEEVPLTVSAAPGPVITNCSQMVDSSGIFNGAKMTNVYVVTALGVSPTGARKMVQSDVALQPTIPFPYGLYATSSACNAIELKGGNATIDSYSIVGGKQKIVNSGANVGSNGGVSVGNGTIYGDVGVLQPAPLGTNACSPPITLGPGGSTLSTAACPSGDNSNPPSSCYIPKPYKFPTPPIPVTPNSGVPSPGACTAAQIAAGAKKGDCITPGTWGNISETGPITLAPGVYNINSISVTGGKGEIDVNPPGTVTINIGGCGDATCSVANQMTSGALDIEGNGIVNDLAANDFTINYGGTGSIAVGGNGVATAILDAPNAALTVKGGGGGKGAWNGAIVANTVVLTGTETFNYDQNTAVAPSNNGYYTMIAYHEVPY